MRLHGILGMAAVSILMSTGASAATTTFLQTIDSDPFDGKNGGTLVLPDGTETLALAKCDQGGTSGTTCSNWLDSDKGAPGDYAGAFELTFTSNKSFEWRFDASGVSGAEPVLFPTALVVKIGGGQQAANWLYSITPGALSGSVDTSSLQNAISHVSFYDGAVAPVPLPAAGWLLVAGVGGMVALRRRKG